MLLAIKPASGSAFPSGAPYGLNPLERLTLLLIPVAWSFFEMGALGDYVILPPHLFFNPFETTAAFTTFVAFVSYCVVRRSNVVEALLLAVALEALCLGVGLAGGSAISSILPTSGLSFWGAILLVQLRNIALSRETRSDEVDLFLVYLALPVAMVLSSLALVSGARVIASTFDAYLYAFDGLFPLPVARHIWSFCRENRWAFGLLWVVYNALFYVLAVMLVMERDVGRHVGKFASRTLFVGFVGFSLYFVLPGVGPKVAFYSAYGQSLPDPMTVALETSVWPPGFVRNAMPSLHVAWSVLIALAAFRYGPGWFSIGAIFAGVTILATMGIGEHYLIDVVVGVPLAFACHFFMNAFEKGPERRGCLKRAGVAAMAVIGWLLCIRYATEHLRGAPWTVTFLALATVGALLPAESFKMVKGPSGQ